MIFFSGKIYFRVDEYHRGGWKFERIELLANLKLLYYKQEMIMKQKSIAKWLHQGIQIQNIFT